MNEREAKKDFVDLAKRNIWIFLLTVSLDIVAVHWWFEFLGSGRVESSRFGFSLAAPEAYVPLSCITIVGLVLTYLSFRHLSIHYQAGT